MATPTDDQELIRKWLRQELSADEQRKLDARIQEDQELAAEMAASLVVKEAFKRQKKQELSQWYRQSRSRRRPLWPWVLGLLLLGLLIWGIWRFSSPQESNPKPVAAIDKVVDSYREELTLMGEGWQDDLLDRRYPQALEKLEEVLAEAPTLEEVAGASYFAGVLHLYLPADSGADPEKAIRYLLAARDLYDAPAQLMLAYEKTGRQEEAVRFFQENPELRAALPDSLLRRLE